MPRQRQSVARRSVRFGAAARAARHNPAGGILPRSGRFARPSSVGKNHYGSRSLRGTEVAAIFYTLWETARFVGVDPYAYLLRAVSVAIDCPGTITYPEELIPSSN